MFKSILVSALALFATLQISVVLAATNPNNVTVRDVPLRGHFQCAGTGPADPARNFTPAMLTPAIRDATARAIDNRTILWGTTRYPHVIRTGGGTPHPPARCSGAVYEHPIFINGLYTGGNPQRDRVRFSYTGLSATFCDVMTHANAPPSEFRACPHRT